MAWRVARSLLTLRDQINDRYPTRNKASDGTIGDEDHQNRSSDHNPWYGPGIVTAMDITHDPASGVDIDRLTDELAASRDSRIKYVIANDLIMSGAGGPSPWVWREYHGENLHKKHFHLSVVASPACDDTSPWNLPSLRTGGGGAAPGQEDDMPYSPEDIALFAYRGTVSALQDAAYHPDSHAAAAMAALDKKTASAVWSADLIHANPDSKDNPMWQAKSALGSLVQAMRGGVDVDEAELARELAPTLAEMLPRIPDDQMAQLIEQIPEETRRRFAAALNQEGQTA
jgi:uncharacterized FlaG/YvyC family protein